MSTSERVRALVEPLVADLELDLYDLEVTGGLVRVTVDAPGGVGMDALASLTRAVSRAVDEHDPVEGSFTLEVSSPGLERTLRTPAHFAGAVGTPVSVKVRPGVEGERRVRGVLEQAGDADITVVDPVSGTTRTIAYDDIERARTVFEWGPAPKPGKGSKPGKAAKPRPGRAPGPPAARTTPAPETVPEKHVPEKKVDAS